MFLNLIFPWEVDPELSDSVKKIIGGGMPTLTTYDSFQGIGTSFTVYFMDYFITFCAKDSNTSISDVMYKCV